MWWRPSRISPSRGKVILTSPAQCPIDHPVRERSRYDPLRQHRKQCRRQSEALEDLGGIHLDLVQEREILAARRTAAKIELAPDRQQRNCVWQDMNEY